MSKWVTIATWKDAPHLTPEQQARLLDSIPPAQRRARIEGLPYIGRGLVYPIDETSIRIADFPVPSHFRRVYSLDTGWDWNSCVWGAWDVENDIVYVYRVFKREALEPPLVASAILAAGAWIPGVADAADINRLDGRQYIEIYRNLGLDIELPDKAIETGIQQVWTRLSTGRLKIFESCVELFEEYRIYSRDDKGILPKQNDHLMDALRYLIMSGLHRAKLPPVVAVRPSYNYEMGVGNELGWMGG